jgi:signal transduction histidine kinase
MSFEHLKATGRTLRFRLMLWNALAVLVTGLAILAALREGVRYTLIYDLDQVLKEDIKEISLNLQGAGNLDWYDLQEELNRKARGHDFHGWFVQFYDVRGNPTWASINSPALPPLTPEQKQADAFTFDDHRIVHRALPNQLTEAGSVCVGCSQRFVGRDMARIDRLVLLVGALVLLAAPLGGYLLAGRTTRLLSNLISRTERLRPSELNERLPIRGTGDELDSLARTVNGLLDRIGDYLRQKHDFLANAAHELRTPLAAIRSSVEVALNSERSESEYQELLSEVIEQCMALQNLVNQLLLLAETDADRLKTNTEPFSLDHLVGRAMEMFHAVAEDHGIKLRAGPMPPTAVAGNRHHLRQVINNLLDNAIKFTAIKYEPGSPHFDAKRRAHGEIVVDLMRDDEKKRAQLRICDNGIGIPAEHLPQLFNRFYRVDKSRSRESGPGGTGLGLSICKAIVEAHYGTITVESTVERGTTFIISLPLAPLAELDDVEREAAVVRL